MDDNDALDDIATVHTSCSLFQWGGGVVGERRVLWRNLLLIIIKLMGNIKKDMIIETVSPRC